MRKKSSFELYFEELQDLRREMLMRAVTIDHNGLVSLSLTPWDWQLHSDSKDCTDAAHELNKFVGHQVNIGASGAELTRRCHEGLKGYAYCGAAGSESTDVLCEVLVFAKRDAEYARNSRHYRDYRDGWRQIGTVDVGNGFMWVGDPEHSPKAPPTPKVPTGFPPIECHVFSRGVGVSIFGRWRSEFTVEGLFPDGLDGQMTSIRVPM